MCCIKMHVMSAKQSWSRTFKLKISERSVVVLPGALAAIFTSKNDRGALWARTVQVSFNCATFCVYSLLKFVEY